MELITTGLMTSLDKNPPTNPYLKFKSKHVKYKTDFIYFFFEDVTIHPEINQIKGGNLPLFNHPVSNLHDNALIQQKK